MEDAMDGLTRVDLQCVVAPLNFMVPMAEKPYAYSYDPPPGVPARNGQMIEYKVTARDARPVNDALSLDRESFVLLHHQTAATDLYDETIITSVYYPECERLMKEAAGTRRVVAFDHIVRMPPRPPSRAGASRCRPGGSTMTTPLVGAAARSRSYG